MSAPEPGDGLADGLKRAADAATPRAVDLDAVLAASRARRRARRTAIVGGVGAVAAVLVVGGLVFGLRGGPGGDATTAGAPAEAPTAGESAGTEAGQGADAGQGAGDEQGAGDASVRLAAPEHVNRCGSAVVPEGFSAGTPLEVSVEPPVAPVAPGGAASVVVTVTNTGDDVVEGELSRAPAITVAEVDVVVWHSSGTSEAGSQHVSLGPGESVSLAGLFVAQRCTAADDDGTELPTDLPPLAPGPYALAASVAFSTPAEGMVLVLSSPLVPTIVG